jgi:hypothetical protein
MCVTLPSSGGKGNAVLELRAALALFRRLRAYGARRRFDRARDGVDRRRAGFDDAPDLFERGADRRRTTCRAMRFLRDGSNNFRRALYSFASGSRDRFRRASGGLFYGARRLGGSFRPARGLFRALLYACGLAWCQEKSPIVDQTIDSNVPVPRRLQPWAVRPALSAYIAAPA